MRVVVGGRLGYLHSCGIARIACSELVSIAMLTDYSYNPCLISEYETPKRITKQSQRTGRRPHNNPIQGRRY